MQPPPPSGPPPPPPLPGDRPGARRSRRLGVLAVIVIVFAVVLLTAIGWVAWLVLAPSSEPGDGKASGPLRILPVTRATPGACPSGGPGVPATDGKQCYRLGGAGMTVTRLESAEAAAGPGGGWQIRIRMNPGDAKRFADLSGRYRGRRLALVSANKVISAPTVQEPISGGEVQITGNFTEDEAERIAGTLPT